MTPAENHDQQLLRELRAGSETALRRIFDAHYVSMVSAAWRIVRDEDASKDLAQEVIVELWRKRSELDVRGSLRAYLTRAVVNRSLNFLKSQKKYVLPGDEDAVFHALDFDDAAEIAENQQINEQKLRTAIEALPEKCRLVFTLSRFEELSHRQIAEQLDISVKTIENQITKAIKLIRKAMLENSDLSAVVILQLFWLT